jgi:hypothetical protein
MLCTILRSSSSDSSIFPLPSIILNIS